MSGRNRITIAQSQRLVLNTRLLSSIRLLGRDAAGLSRFLEEAAAENPQLLVETAPLGEWLPRWSEALRSPYSGADARGSLTMEELTQGAAPSLQAHASRLVSGLRLSGAEAAFGERLVMALDPSGWLGRSLADLAAESGLGLARAEQILAQVQAEAEPTGLFARSLSECLRLQAEEEGWLDPVVDGVLFRLRDVAGGLYNRVAVALGVDEAAILAILRRIRALDPKPGAQFGACAAPLREPDLIARRGAQGWEVELNASALPSLRLADLPSEARSEDLAQKRAEAQGLIRQVQGRNAALLRVGREMMRRQVLALEEGIGALRPMTMAEVAAATGLHQSSVSRVIAGAAIDTPLGTWWLRKLFSQSIGGRGPSAAALREALARMIADEDPAQPLSDAALSAALGGAGAPVARRTVAKYRDTLGIPPAQQRAQLRTMRDRKGRS
ncbi:RNA polymerase sigma-54 factor [Xinfangfangia sp. CPCC 101601]|uniref:RNA polymerase sigma-54 factor n=1 Tax=Pseudogemmobacter lacusdianii TaxID=3069608 RepID=A0ABU0VW41_9RHOB|nr:RNA polymerase sigma-54 factor [Xinfangfangia sp. CPCC 101601]MDQ2065971.1 RNA polymerase sigma-54 factor [Xinfangfangia sp. CPCC 101601]